MSPISIVCDFNLGVKSQTIYYCNAIENSVTPIAAVDLDTMAATISNACMEYHTNYVHLYGVKEILEHIAFEIKSYAFKNYNNSNITVEIN